MSLQVPVLDKTKKAAATKRKNAKSRQGGCGCLEEKRPANIVAALFEHKDKFSTLIRLAETAELVEKLTAAANVSLFAPTNDAFAKLFKANPDLQNLKGDALQKVLLAHVLPSSITPNAPNFDKLTTLNAEATISLSSGSDQFSSGIYVNGYPARPETIVTENNSIVFIMDDVLLPGKRKGGDGRQQSTSAGTRRSARLQKMEPERSVAVDHKTPVNHAVATKQRKALRKGGAGELSGLMSLLDDLKGPQFDQFKKWVSNESNVTIMAPSQVAVTKFLENKEKPSPAKVEAILRAHIIPHRMDNQYLTALFKQVPGHADLGFSVPTAIVNKFVHMLFYNDGILYGTAKVILTDQSLTGDGTGPVVHVIDKVLNVITDNTQIISLK